LNKRHPGVKPESVHELNLPILKQQRDYYCHLCEKVCALWRLLTRCRQGSNLGRQRANTVL
jgi:hypothetical protein